MLGFGYAFDSLASALRPQGSGEGENELARAFAVIFGTARKFRVVTILQVWFPVLRRFVRVALSYVLPVHAWRSGMLMHRGSVGIVLRRTMRGRQCAASGWGSSRRVGGMCSARRRGCYKERWTGGTC